MASNSVTAWRQHYQWDCGPALARTPDLVYCHHLFQTPALGCRAIHLFFELGNRIFHFHKTAVGVPS